MEMIKTFSFAARCVHERYFVGVFHTLVRKKICKHTRKQWKSNVNSRFAKTWFRISLHKDEEIDEHTNVQFRWTKERKKKQSRDKGDNFKLRR